MLEILSRIWLRSCSALISMLSNKWVNAAQETIGLTHKLLRDWSPQYTCLQKRHYQRKSSQRSCNKWLRDLIEVTVTETHGLCLDRNKNLREARVFNTTEITAIDIIVADQQQQGLHDLLMHHFKLFQQDLYEILDQSTKVKWSWLDSVMIASQKQGFFPKAKKPTIVPRGKLSAGESWKVENLNLPSTGKLCYDIAII